MADQVSDTSSNSIVLDQWVVTVVGFSGSYGETMDIGSYPLSAPNKDVAKAMGRNKFEDRNPHVRGKLTVLAVGPFTVKE